jgi:ribokinase
VSRNTTITTKIRDYYSSMNSIVVMPDFFLDRIMRLTSKEEFFNVLTEKARFGGGSIRDIPTKDVKGGNAVNIAYSLARLGANVALFTIGDEIASAILHQTFLEFRNNVDLFIVPGNHGRTTSLEFLSHEDIKFNLMVSDVGDNANFGPEKVNSEEHLKILGNADATIVTNWSSNLKGTELAEYVFENSSKALHFIDPADVESRRLDFQKCLELISEITDVLSINENECNSLGKAIGLGTLIPEHYEPEIVKNAAKTIADNVKISTDLHTRKGSAWSNGREAEFVHSIRVEAKTLTGAGDVWDAADIIGYMSGLDAKERLVFSNASVSLYVRNSSALPPRLDDVFDMLDRIGA